MLTAYDYPTAQILDEAGIPLLLVGDSLGQVLLGYESTVRVTMTEMLHHTKAVVRGSQRAMVIGDMPFLTYSTVDEALENAGRFLQEAGAQAVKVEGGVRSARIIEAMVKAGIPVMGHIGWTPQAQHGMGGKVKVQGKDRTQARSLLADALAVQEAGRLLDRPRAHARRSWPTAITERLRIPTIGIGAGPGCSGQVQVITDLLGLGDFMPRHARPYAHLRDDDRRGGAGVRRRRRGGHVPGRGRDGPDGRRGARRGARPGRVRPGRRHASRSAASRSTATSDDPRTRPMTEVAKTTVVRTRAELRAALAAAPRPVGLVPTMGWLHEGHRALMRRGARRERHGRGLDLRQSRASSTSRPTSRATRATRRATWRCARRRASTSSSRPRSRRSTRRVSRRRCRSGRSPCRWRARRGPGHFDGVATVVAILFDLVGAERAYFGQKDAQQVMVIRQMARDLAIGTEVVACPTIREPDGLALSSRNVHLTPDERAAAPVLRRALARGARRVARRASATPSGSATRCSRR